MIKMNFFLLLYFYLFFYIVDSFCVTEKFTDVLICHYNGNCVFLCFIARNEELNSSIYWAFYLANDVKNLILHNLV